MNNNNHEIFIKIEQDNDETETDNDTEKKNVSLSDMVMFEEEFKDRQESIECLNIPETAKSINTKKIMSINEKNHYKSEKKEDEDEDEDDDEEDGVRGGDDEKNIKIILDWDDTILPTTWLQNISKLNLGLNENETESKNSADVSLHPFIQIELCILSNEIILFLVLLEQFGSITIITNAEEGWVEKSCKKYIPDVWSFIKNYKIVSARTKFQHEKIEEENNLKEDQMWNSLFLKDKSYLWKFRAFFQNIKPHHEQLWAFGDNYHDSAVACDMLKFHTQLKTVKIIQFSLTNDANQITKSFQKFRHEIFKNHYFNDDCVFKMMNIDQNNNTIITSTIPLENKRIY